MLWRLKSIVGDDEVELMFTVGGYMLRVKTD